MQASKWGLSAAPMLFVLLFNPALTLPTTKQPIEIHQREVVQVGSGPRTENFPIILYHHIRPLTSDMSRLARDLSVTPDAFEEQLRHLASHNYDSMPLRDFAANLSVNLPIPQNSFALTFDDGYQDFYTHAWPLLKQYRMHATLFVIINRIGTPDYVTWEQIKELAASELVSIESHTLNHPQLDKLTLKKARFEIEQSKKILEQQLGHPVALFCYPYGSYTQEIAKAVKQAGYNAAITTKGGTTHSRHSLFELRRVRLSTSDTGTVLERKILSFFGQKTP